MCVIYVVEEHQQVLNLWRTQEAKSLRVLHLDAHCDMRGLLINRQTQTAYRIWDKNQAVGQGNFLTHAVIEGRISSLRWVYNELGGRIHDVGTVKYESDYSALPYRWFQRLTCVEGIPIQYQDLPYAFWKDLESDEYLDIDWDFFAGITSPLDTIQDRVRKFLNTKFSVKPAEIYVCYSPEFSHPSRQQFRRFIADLALLFSAEVINVPIHENLCENEPFYRKYQSHPIIGFIRKIYYAVHLGLRRRGIF